MRPGITADGKEYEVRFRIELEDEQKLDLILDIKQLKILAINSYNTAELFNISVTNPIAEKAATWWGMS